MAGTCAGDNAKLVKKPAHLIKAVVFGLQMKRGNSSLGTLNIGIQILNLLRCFSVALVEF